jgi:hypothetical protein
MRRYGEDWLLKTATILTEIRTPKSQNSLRRELVSAFMSAVPMTSLAEIALRPQNAHQHYFRFGLSAVMLWRRESRRFRVV